MSDVDEDSVRILKGELESRLRIQNSAFLEMSMKSIRVRESKWEKFYNPASFFRPTLASP